MSNIFIPSTILKQAKGIRLGQGVLWCLISVTIFCLSRRLRRQKVVAFHFCKNRKPFCDFIRFWLYSDIC